MLPSDVRGSGRIIILFRLQARLARVDMGGGFLLCVGVGGAGGAHAEGGRRDISQKLPIQFESNETDLVLQTKIAITYIRFLLFI